MADTRKTFHRIRKTFDEFEGDQIDATSSGSVPAALGRLALVAMVSSRASHYPLTEQQRDKVVTNVLSLLLGSSEKEDNISTTRRLSAKLEDWVQQAMHQQAAPLAQPDGIGSFKNKRTDFYSLSGRSRYSEDFEEIGPIAKGGYGKVYKARQKLVDLEYAIKKVKLRKNWAENDKLLWEVRCLAQLDHPNIVRYYNCWLEWSHGNQQDEESEGIPSPTRSFEGQPNSRLPDEELESMDVGSGTAGLPEEELGTLYLKMELCSTTLKHWLEERNKSISSTADAYSVAKEPINRSIFTQVVQATAYLHSQGLLHRDIKPANIFLNESNMTLRAKLGDLGLVQFIQPSTFDRYKHPPYMDPSLVDEEKAVMSSDVGTQMYAAPEQLQGDVYSQKCDMYSLGIILFELFCPWKTRMERAQDLHDLRSHRQPPRFMEMWPTQSKYIEKLTSEESSSRPDAQELLDSPLCRETEGPAGPTQAGDYRPSPPQGLTEHVETGSSRSVGVQYVRQLEDKCAKQEAELRLLRERLGLHDTPL